MKKEYFCVKCGKVLEIIDPYIFRAWWIEGVVYMKVNCKNCGSLNEIEIIKKEEEIKK